MAAMPLAPNGREKTKLSQSEDLGRRHRGGSLFTQMIVVSLVVFGALRFVLEKFWLAQLSSVDNFSLYMKASPSSSTFDKRILVVLPMMGLKKTGLIEDDVVTEERLAIQSWNLLAEDLAAANPSSHSPNGPLRVLGMVGALSECDPWLYRFTNPKRYACQVLPVECLQAKYDDIPMLNCLLETAVDEAKRTGEELVLFANGDVSFSLDLLDVVSSIYGRDSILMNNTTRRDAGSHVVVVGQRTDVEVALDKTPLSLTRQALIDLHSQAKAEGSLHQDFGIDYFLFPLEALPRRFPPFLVGRFRWDNALLATFLMQGATTVDATETLSVVHFGVHASDTAHHSRRLGADYNNELVHTYYNKAFMLGRISNTGWIHQASVETRDDEKPSYLLVPREAPTDSDLLRAFQLATFESHANLDAKETTVQRDRKLGAGRANEYPTLLLIAVSQQKELDTLVGHRTVTSQSIPVHAMFLTKDPEIYSELNSHFESRTFLEQKVNWSSPAASIEWQTFGRLLSYSIAVVLTRASVWIDSSDEKSSQILEHPDWNLRTGDVALHPQDLEQVVGIRPTETGLAFWEAYRDCHSGKRREEMVAMGNVSALGDWPSRHHQVQTPLTKVQCLEAIRETFATAIHEKPSSKPFSKTLKMQGGVLAENVLDPTLSNARRQEENIYDQSLGNVSANSQPAYLPTLQEAQNRLDQVRQALEDTSACNKSSIPEKLHMVLTITNPGMYASRYILARDFIQRITRHDSAHVELYIIECAYNGQPFNMTQASNPRHLQVRAPTPLWHKENLINVAVARLLPPDWQALAWVDAEIEFESPTWAVDALQLLLHAQTADIIQLFSFAQDLGDKRETVHVYTGFIYNYVKQIAYQKKGTDLWHPGYAWGCSRRAYEQVGGLFEGNILGGGDQCTAYALLGMHAQLPDTLKLFPSKGYKEAVFAWEDRFKGLRMGYVPGVIQHHYHGSVKDRKYWERRDLLSDAGFDPQTHVAPDERSGVLVPTPEFPPGLATGILDYFQSRKEDAITSLKPQALTYNPTRDAIANNKPLPGPLPVIILVPPGPLVHASQDDAAEPDLLVRHYLERFQHQNPKDIEVYLVEVAPSADSFRFTNSGNPRHLQHIALDLTDSDTPCSGHHLRNLAVRELLPATWEAMAWVEIGAELESRTWAQDVLRLLNQKSYDAVQLFSHAAETDAWGNTTNIWSGFGYNHERGIAYESDPARKDSSWYPGGGWAYSRRAFDAGPGLLELSTDAISREDEIQAKCLLGLCSSSGERLEASALKFEARWKSMRVGYVPGVLKQWTLYNSLLRPPM